MRMGSWQFAESKSIPFTKKMWKKRKSRSKIAKMSKRINNRKK